MRGVEREKTVKFFSLRKIAICCKIDRDFSRSAELQRKRGETAAGLGVDCGRGGERGRRL